MGGEIPVKTTERKFMAEEEAKKLDAVEAPETETAEPETFAKSGKKSKKHIEEVKAEEERQALEQAAREAEAANASQVDKLKAKVNTAVNTDAIKTMAKEKTVTVGKSKVPLFAAIGAAVVVVIKKKKLNRK